LLIKFTNNNITCRYLLENKYAFIEIKKKLIPKFDWKLPDNWAEYLGKQNTIITIEAATKSVSMTEPNLLSASIQSAVLFSAGICIQQ